MWDKIVPGSTDLFLRDCWTPKTLHLELVFFLAKLAFGQRTAHALTTNKMHDIWTGQAGYKKKDCQILPRQGEIVLKIFLLENFEKCLSVTLGFSQSGLPQHCKWDFRWLPRLSLSFLASFGSCLIALPANSSNIISLLGSLLGLKTR